MAANTVAERIRAHDSLTGQTHESFRMHAQKGSAFFGIDVGLRTGALSGQIIEKIRGSARPLYFRDLGRDFAALSI